MVHLDLVLANLVSPITLCFVLGALAAALRSDLRIPDPVFRLLSIYLMLAIGLKGGADLARTPFADMWRPALAALALGGLIPLLCYVVLRRLAGFMVADAAALAAHYGSVSAVTFIAVLAYLDAAGLTYEGYVTALLAIMEVPAIVVALACARLAGQSGQPLSRVIRETVSGKSIVLLVGGMAIGAMVGTSGLQPVKPLFVDLFRGLLCLFMIELGIQTMERVTDLRRSGAVLVVFALVAPVVNGCLGLIAASLAGMSVGGAIVLATLAASASYIVAPAAVRMALPEANPSLYLTASLAVTFPFNLIAGIPLYGALARALYG
ncbi:sodium-dependent bicarbonate transport family permease [Phreatobacter aquaticus]|uniref:Sodium-dependent bicarbonate transport family permease n=1 Tax=Phreatobacter aquaticus TaxID=2570229 RepID=A0A4D7QND2_9HYPH|nr:sodium-dependent bicarbonate transport family permease [Phreatobacter aquaticus]QCK88011.1 sodium-dependent bicarbonate transport family permease [Phreatobacter aquaticus]